MTDYGVSPREHAPAGSANVPDATAGMPAAPGMSSASGSDPLLELRAEFPILERTTYLVSNSLGAMPRATADRMAEYAEAWNEWGVRAWAREWWDMPIRVGNEVAPLLGAREGEVAMVPNVSMAQAAVVSAVSFRAPRNALVTTELDFPSVRYVYERLATKLGARLVVVPSDDGITIDQARLLEAIDERTALVAVSHVLFKSAYVMDAAAICRRAREVGALVSLDAYHAVGVLPVDVQELGVDFLSGGVLKWLCGGPGGSFLYVRPELSRTLEPAVTGWQAHARPFGFEPQMEYAEGAERWLGGTPPIPALYAAQEGPRLVRRAGVQRVRDKSTRQTGRLIELAREHGWRINSPTETDRRGGTVTVEVPYGYEVAQALLARQILVDYRAGAGIRIAPHFYTRDDEVDLAIASIAEIIDSGEWKAFAGSRAIVT